MEVLSGLLDMVNLTPPVSLLRLLAGGVLFLGGYNTLKLFTFEIHTSDWDDLIYVVAAPDLKAAKANILFKWEVESPGVKFPYDIPAPEIVVDVPGVIEFTRSYD